MIANHLEKKEEEKSLHLHEGCDEGCTHDEDDDYEDVHNEYDDEDNEYMYEEEY